MPTTAPAQIISSETSLYTNPIALDKWPSLTAHYLFALESEKPQLQLQLFFDCAAYSFPAGTTPTDEQRELLKNKAAAHLQTYLQVYYQLNNTSKFNFTLNSSIENSIGDDKKPVVNAHTINTEKLIGDLVAPVIQVLKNIAAGGSMPVDTGIPLVFIISVPVDATHITTLPHISPLTVTAVMQRLENKEVQPVIDAKEAATTLHPLPADATGKYTPSTPTYHYFAKQFETAFLNRPSSGIIYKIATGGEPTANPPSLWVIRFDTEGTNGLKFSFNDASQYYFAPKPLSTSFHSYSGSLKEYVTGQPFPAGDISQMFAVIDIDSWANEFFEAIDKFLSPAYAIPAFMLYASNAFSTDPDYVQTLMDARNQLADAISNTVENIMPAADASVVSTDTAKEKWNRQLRARISNAYRYPVLVQTNASITPATTTTDYKNLWLNGGMMGQPQGGTTDEYLLTGGSVDVASQNVVLTYMLEAKDASAQRNLVYDASYYLLAHMEFAITDEARQATPLRLSFIIPAGQDATGQPGPLALMGKIGKTEIPVPLRSYPVAPVISAQNYEYPLNGPNPPVPTITNTRTWNYIYTYLNPQASQDTVITKIYTNTNPAPPNSTLANADGMLAALAQFIVAYPAIAADFDKYLAPLDYTAISGTGTSVANARYAVLAFIAMVQDVVTQWAPTATPATSTPPEQAVLAQALIIENAAAYSNDLLIGINTDALKPGLNITVDIPGYTRWFNAETKTSRYTAIENGTLEFLTYADRNKVPDRIVTLSGLDILNIPGATGCAGIIRNGHLLQNENGMWRTVNEDFVYRTPLTTPSSDVAPFLESQTALDISAIVTGNHAPAESRTLLQHLNILFEALTENWETHTAHAIQLDCTYSYEMPPSGLTLQLPVTKVPLTMLEKADRGNGMAIELENIMTSWFTQNNPELNAGQYNFTFTLLYPGDDNVPLLKFPLYLEIDKVK